ncbi:MAG: MFS transporter [Pseudomonadota bacterium]
MTEGISGAQRLTILVTVALAAFLVSVSVGMNAVIFPTTLQAYGASTSVVGVIMSVEIISILVISAGVPKIVATIGARTAMLLTVLFRVPALILLCFVTDIPMWGLLVFIHGIGNFLFVLLLQAWLNDAASEQTRGLSLAILGTSLSLGLAGGPIVLSQIEPYHAELLSILEHVAPFVSDNLGNVVSGAEDITQQTQAELTASAIISLLAVVPLLLTALFVRHVEAQEQGSLKEVVWKTPAAMFAVMMAGVSIYGVQSFIVIYGILNDMSITKASFLLTAFMVGSITLEAPIAWLSDFVDRRYVIMVGALLSLTCAVFLPMAIYTNVLALGLLYIWGGVIGGLYSTCLALIGDRYSGGELIAANAAFWVMDSIGGVIGVLLIGLSIDVFGSDGLPYVIMLASVVYFSYALTRYRVE